MVTSVKRAVGVMVALLVAIAAMTAGTQAAFATGDRPTNVAWVKAYPVADLKPDGSVVVTEKIACRPGWVSSDLSVMVSQQSGAYADGVTTTAVPCDLRWHTIKLTTNSVFMKMTKGYATISSQFLVNNAESGDSAGAHHVVKKGWIRIAPH